MLFIPDNVRRRLLTERDQHPGTAVTVRDRIKNAGLRPTKQRLALGHILFKEQQGHTTADQLHRETVRSGARMSLATVYNTLNQFADAGLLSRVNLDGEQSYFDINTSNHHHFHLQATGLLIDIPAEELTFGKLPSPPDGYRISKIDVLIGLEPVIEADCPLSVACTVCGGREEAESGCAGPKPHTWNEKRPRQ
ncbi:iron response transcriptional regulator IrrA [Phyllobacterium myrsinacearum]|uniref:Ferric uptake regulation protein n=1 Tax=Phyllobacterium myrsinacearum TaxID=28101 RepID=A0A839ECS0_9HYPH|nr:Fur family transcriptional regulator [Phyllobacterium myrsinacearum]MBA8876732.1 Fur family iron response transcriptional regulator [Phyllobacterium myrsinacearum]